MRRKKKATDGAAPETQTGATETPTESATEETPAPKKRRRRRKKTPAEGEPDVPAEDAA